MNPRSSLWAEHPNVLLPPPPRPAPRLGYTHVRGTLLATLVALRVSQQISWFFFHVKHCQWYRAAPS